MRPTDSTPAASGPRTHRGEDSLTWRRGLESERLSQTLGRPARCGRRVRQHPSQSQLRGTGHARLSGLRVHVRQHTHKIAESIASGFPSTSDTEVVSAAEARHHNSTQYDLVVVGGPTHAHGLSRRATRESAAEWAAKDASREVEPSAAGIGIGNGSRDSASHTARRRLSTPESKRRHSSPAEPPRPLRRCSGSMATISWLTR
jgi:hypothetical protein